MSFRNDMRESEEEKEICETVKKLADLLNKKYSYNPSDKDEWGFRRHFTS